MSGAALPEDGPALIAGIQLPPGQRIYGLESGDAMPHIAWATSRPMAGASDAFFALSAAHARTGLVPILLASSDVTDDIEEAFFFLEGPEDLSLIDAMDPEEVLAAQWDLGDGEFLDADLRRHMLAPSRLRDQRPLLSAIAIQLAAQSAMALAAQAGRTAVTAAGSAGMGAAGGRPED